MPTFYFYYYPNFDADAWSVRISTCVIQVHMVLQPPGGLPSLHEITLVNISHCLLFVNESFAASFSN